MKTLENVNVKTGLSRDYLNALAPAENFVKRVKENAEGVVEMRWVNLAYRTMQQRGVIPYRDYFESLEFEVPKLSGEQSQYGARLDELVSNINQPFDVGINLGAMCDVDKEYFKLVEDSTKKAVNLIRLGREEI